MSIAKKTKEATGAVEAVDHEELLETSSKELAPKKSAPPAMAGTGGGLLSAEETADLEMGFGAFPIISLDKGEFIDTEGKDYGDEFYCRMMKYRAKYFYKSEVDKDDVEFFYTYDKENTVGGESVDELLEEWEESGRPRANIKKYLEVTAQLFEGDEPSGLVILSIAPTSVARFSGYVMGELNAARGLRYDQVITKVSAGERITKDKYNWKPWKFELHLG